MSSDSVALYSQVYQRLTEAGVVVNAPAGNDGNSSYGTDPDTGLLGFPAFYSSTLAVASVNEQDAADLGTISPARVRPTTCASSQRSPHPAAR